VRPERTAARRLRYGAASALLVATSAVARADEAPGLTADASVRLRFESTDASFLGPPSPAPGSVLLTRVLAGVAARSPSGVGAFVQLGWHDEAGREPGPVPTDVDGVDVQQAYVDFAWSKNAQLRIGRQELVLGSARLVSVRESPNIRRAFDGATLALSAGPWRVKLLALATVNTASGAFDDRTQYGIRLDGAYATRVAPNAGPSADLYLLRYRNEHARYAIGTGRERRESFGVRVFDARGRLDYNFEAIAQSGTFATRGIRAWTFASDTGYTFRDARFAPRVGLKANVTSGDRDPGDRRLGTFNPLFPNLAYFSEAATIAPQNHQDLQLSVTLQPARDWTARLGVDRFRRTTASDAVYRGNGVPYVVTGADRRVARQETLDLGWRPGAAIELKASALHWTPAAPLARSGAGATWFGMVSVLIRM
jgi:hypothetical protein